MSGIATEDLVKIRGEVHSIQAQIAKKVIGSERIVRFMFIALFSDNHVLLEGVPGLAKTMLAFEFSKHLGLDFKRIQFTPDMLPSDVTGSIIFNLESKKMEFRRGPIFANVLLADELNRTPPKVQSALLEGMEEKQVSVGGTSEKLPLPFFVMATQNPIEQEGTFPLAEALMDRFLFRYFLAYPSRDQEIGIVKSVNTVSENEITPLGQERILKIRSLINDVYASDEILSYIVDIIRKNRESNKIYLGASPRTTAKMLRAAKANALVNGRDYLIPEDVKFLSNEMLNHRLILNSEAIIEAGSQINTVVESIIQSTLAEVKAPQ